MILVRKKKKKLLLTANKPAARRITKKVFTHFRPMILTRHPSHKHLRTDLGVFPFRSVIRLGSTTTLTDPTSLAGNRLEINCIQGIKNSASKLLMKRCFTEAKVKTADWIGSTSSEEIITWSKGKFPVLAKLINGSRGNGITMIKSPEELKKCLIGKNLGNYIFEKYYNFTKEYRIHVTEDGCFYTCRKMLKSDVPENKRFIRNDSTCSWFVEQNPEFNKPTNWDKIVAECVKALKAVKLDIAGFDVRVQSDKTAKGEARKEPDFIIIESNSACSHGDLTAVKYTETLKRLLNKKAGR